MLDLSNPYHAQIDRRLRTEPIIWLTTSSPAGRPHIAPMWFLWDGRSVLLFSLPKTRKVRNIDANSTVVLALDAADQGYDVVIVDGEAQLLRDATITGSLPAFVEKYAAIPRRWPPEEWAEKFTEAIRVAPTRLRAWRTRPGIPPEYASVEFTT